MLANSLDFTDSFIGSSEEFKKRCVDVFERLSKHTESHVKATESRELCWVLLARLLFRCDEETLRALGSRVSKRMVDVTRQPMSKAILVFMRAAVDRIPSLMAQNQKTLRGLCLSALDFGVLTAHSGLHTDSLELAIDIFATCFGFSESRRILNTVKALLDETVLSEASSDDVIFIEQVKFSDRRVLLIRTMFLLYRRSLQKARKEKNLNLGAFLALAEKALRLDSPEVATAVLSALQTLIRRCRWGTLTYSSTIVSLLMERVLTNELACSVLAEMSELFGASSTICKHPDFITLTKIGSWIENDHSQKLSELMSSVLKSSAFMMKRHTLLEMQHDVCVLLLQRGPSVPLMNMLSAFLLLNHEQIPAPIQIARTLAYRWCPTSYDSDVAQAIRSCRTLCDSISHPRIQLLAGVRVQVAEIAEQAESERKKEEVEAALQEAEEPVPEEEVKPSTHKVAVVSTSSQTEKEKVEEAPKPKRSLETAPNPVEEAQPVKKLKVEEPEVCEVKPVADVVPKPKKQKAAPKAVEPPKQVLAEGELSVEDMLSDFCA
uniref:RAP domain-containing protein n=1 Tax=Steinernema glaseri TaxID=37863 RepID=A0A1I8AA48_9BILA